jgi:hypothetical protein
MAFLKKIKKCGIQNFTMKNGLFLTFDMLDIAMQERTGDTHSRERNQGMHKAFIGAKEIDIP